MNKTSTLILTILVSLSSQATQAWSFRGKPEPTLLERVKRSGEIAQEFAEALSPEKILAVSAFASFAFGILFGKAIRNKVPKWHSRSCKFQRTIEDILEGLELQIGPNDKQELLRAFKLPRALED